LGKVGGMRYLAKIAKIGKIGKMGAARKTGLIGRRTCPHVPSYR